MPPTDARAMHMPFLFPKPIVMFFRAKAGWDSRVASSPTSTACGRWKLRPREVSILVLLDAGPRRVATLTEIEAEVSILVLLDAGPRPPAMASGQQPTCAFRSLFSWMLVRDQLGRRPGTTARHGFDPCSPGCWSATAAISTLHDSTKWFRSLFSWMLVRDGRVICAGGSRLAGFDPCSPGCWSATHRRPRPATVSIGVSILVLLDAGPRRSQRSRCGRYDARVSILVLLDAGPRRAGATASRRRHDGGFDPCSPGCWPRRQRSADVATARPVFRSLFSWMLVRDAHRRELAAVSYGGFDPCSPGCWPRRPSTSHAGAVPAGFDPCSPGCWPRHRRIARLHGHRRRVSILVLLDAGPRRRHRTSRHRMRFRVSILVLLDADPRRPWRSTADLAALWFRSLFSWMLVATAVVPTARIDAAVRVSILVLLDAGPRRLAERLSRA